jgi:spermidine synthase
MTNKTHLDATQWFTEIHPHVGSAFSLAITEKLHEEQTPFQHIEVYRTRDFGNLLVIDGTVQLTSRDIFVYHDMMAHPILFTHSNPEQVAIIGGGDCGVLHEVLKHSNVKRCVQIDIDECVTRMAKLYFPEFCQSNQDPRAELRFEDGVAWIAAQPEHSLDVIIIDSTDPVGPATGLFGETFYRQCRRVLRDSGIIIHQSESPLYYLNEIIVPMHGAMQRAGFTQTQTLYFPVVGYPSGWWSATMASPGKMLQQFREDDAKNKGFSTEYYTAAIHQGALAAPAFVRMG